MKKSKFYTQIRFGVLTIFLIIGVALFITGFVLPTYTREICTYTNCTCTNSNITIIEDCEELLVCFYTDQSSIERCANFYPKEITPDYGCPISGTTCWYRTWPDDGVGFPLYVRFAPENYRAPIVMAGTCVILVTLFIGAVSMK